jgi:hypothetical protein
MGSRNASDSSTTSSRFSSSSNKSVRFSDTCSSVYYTYGSSDYERGSFDLDDMDHGLRVEGSDAHVVLPSTDKDYFNTMKEDSDCSDTVDDRTQQDMAWDEQVRRNTKVNTKRGHHSVAVLIQYRSNF